MSTKAFDQKPDGTVTITLTIPQGEIGTQYQSVLREVQKTAEIKGFRRGHAPLKLVESSSDPAKLQSHVLEHLLPKYYSDFLTTHKLSPLTDPQIIPVKYTLEADWVLNIKLATTPQFTLGDYAKAVKSALAKHAKEHKTTAKEDHSDHLEAVVFDALLDSTKITVSPVLIDEETKSALNRLATQLAQLKVSVADYAKSVKKSTEELVTEYKKTAETNLKLEFILQKIVQTENPVITDAEIAKLKPAKGQEMYAKYILQKRAVLDKLLKL